MKRIESQINSVVFEGTVINEPEVVAKSATSDKRLVKCTLANDQYFTDEDGNVTKETTFMVVGFWGELGEKVLEVINRGMVVRAVGAINTIRWVTKTGESRHDCEIVANHIEYRWKEKNAIMEVTA